MSDKTDPKKTAEENIDKEIKRAETRFADLWIPHLQCIKIFLPFFICLFNLGIKIL